MGRAVIGCLCSVGLLLIVIGSSLIVGGYFIARKTKGNDLIDDMIKKSTVAKGHISYEQLQSPFLVIYKDFFFFNITNIEEFANTGGTVAPNLTEVGPYSFKEYGEKKLVKTSNVTELNYTQTKYFIFDSSKSGNGLSDTDIICTINIPLVAVISRVKDNAEQRRNLRKIISKSNAKIYVCKKAIEIAWGYTDSFIEELYNERLYPQKVFSILVNDSSHDKNISTLNTGTFDIKKVGQFIQWNGQRQLNIWQDDSEANNIQGTEGLFFSPNLKLNDSLILFIDVMERSFGLLYEGTVEHLKLNAYRYGIDNNTFKSAFTEPKNAQYFSWCPDGMFNLGPTQVGQIPIFGSKPHFLDGDPLLLQPVNGLKPDRLKHDTFLDVEPTTGISVFFMKRLQFNLQVNRTEKNVSDSIFEAENISGYNNTGVLYLPAFYINEHAEIDQEFKDYLENNNVTVVIIFDAGSITSLTLGIIGDTIGFFLKLAGLVLIFLENSARGGSRKEYTPLRA